MVNKWDERFLNLADYWAGECSKDPSTKVGAVLVSPDRRQVILGYNGFPRGVWDKEDLYENKQEKYPRVVHAELNAILNSPVRPEGWTIYVSPIPPCTECTKAIIQSGIKRVVFRAKPELGDKWIDSWKIAEQMLLQSDVVVHNE